MIIVLAFIVLAVVLVGMMISNAVAHSAQQRFINGLYQADRAYFRELFRQLAEQHKKEQEDGRDDE